VAKHVLDTFFFSSRLVYDKQRTEPRDLECMRMTPFFFLLFLYQKGRDGVTSAKVLAYGGDTVEGISYYTIEYQSSSSRGDKHFISKVTIVDKKVPTPPCSPPPPHSTSARSSPHLACLPSLHTWSTCRSTGMSKPGQPHGSTVFWDWSTVFWDLSTVF